MSGNPFYDAANAVIAQYDKRMQYMKPARAVGESANAVLNLGRIADAARYAGHPAASIVIENAAKYWQCYGKKPATFSEDTPA
ncbi:MULTISPECIES: hypothetical protein [Serratia]|uniref:Uncharacterized protein n=1 Tax=Serratia marcescens TaxID=615 RepID=A0ABD5BMC8_SERMA|nr:MULTISPECIES: hypothetical protein [Serratia]MBH2564083.1 hypothetical protein [Serratia marcescens]MBH2568985.1 hypothetical protein [Serratia marcescens]MBN5375624.1 hypothetical protein [Serratia marcescens]MBN5438250.1 hypothetical protein [Serratia marcescens]MDQ9401597.1 hypothetical protein [Serratia marcescens]